MARHPFARHFSLCRHAAPFPRLLGGFEAKRRSGALTVWSFDLKLALAVSGVWGGGADVCTGGVLPFRNLIVMNLKPFVV